MNIQILFILLLFMRGMRPFLHKELYKDIGYENILCFKAIIMSILFILYFIYDYKNKKIAFNNMCENKKLLKYFYLSILISILGGFLYYLLLNKYDITYIVPLLKSLSVISIIIIGYTIFDENLSKNKITGIIAIAFGMYLINK